MTTKELYLDLMIGNLIYDIKGRFVEATAEILLKIENGNDDYCPVHFDEIAAKDLGLKGDVLHDQIWLDMKNKLIMVDRFIIGRCDYVHQVQKVYNFATGKQLTI